jgi:general secretion pathway protein G
MIVGRVRGEWRGAAGAARRHQAGYSMIELMIVLVFISIVASIALNYASYAFDASRVGRTVAEMRTVANALTKHQTDTSALPGGGLQPVSAIAPTVRAASGVIPTVDGWNNPIYYEPYTTAQGTLTFRLYSYGRDGVSDGVITGTWVDFSTDIVVEGGSFLQTNW